MTTIDLLSKLCLTVGILALSAAVALLLGKIIRWGGS